MASTPSRLDAVINLAKRRGFVFPCGEIYGGTRSAWDYGPLGVELKENIKRQWWQYMVRSRDDVVGLDSSVILPRETWVASGHVGAFTDPLVESLHTHKRYRADQLIEDYAARKGLDPENVTLDMVPDPVTGQPGSWTEPREFSGLLKTYLGPVDDESGLHYLRLYEHPAEKLSHYSKRTVDLEYRFGFAGSEWGELEGIANRTDFDLSTHAEHSGKDLSYFDQTRSERWTPYVIEPSAGLTRSLMAFLVEAYTEDEAPNTEGGVDKRIVLKLDARIAPVKAAVLPLSRKEELTGPAKELAARLRRSWNVEHDDAGAVGRRYRRQDEVGTPFCLTYDFDSPEDGAVTVRERDTMTQERIPLEGVERYLAERLIGC